MKLLESIDCKKGITLNSQLVELLSIIDNQTLTAEQQDELIKRYIDTLRDRQDRYLDAKSNGTGEIFVLKEVIGSIKGLSDEQKQKLQGLYENSFEGMRICDNAYMNELLKANGFDGSINTKIMKDLRNIDFTAKEGILELTPEKVRALHAHMFEKGNTYDRVTFDNVGKFSSYVSIDGQTYADEKLKMMLEFCERHNMQSKVNTLMFYADYPDRFKKMLDQNGTLTQQEKSQKMKQILFDYVSDIGEKYGDRIDTIDIFNELIYDPTMKEKGPNGQDIFDEGNTYHERTKGWQEVLSLEDLCEMALLVRKKMPNVTFTYNDVNWVNPEKRAEIIKIVQEIQKIEQRYRAEGKLEKDEKGLIDTIGLEAHLPSDVDLSEIDRTFDDIEREIELPVEVTELDVGIYDKDPSSVRSVNRQSAVFRKFKEIAERRPELISLTIWSQSDECCFLNKKVGRNVYASLLDSDFQEKDISERTREFPGKSMVRNGIGKIKAIVGLVKESIRGVPNFTLLDQIEQEEARELNNQRGEQENTQDI